MATLSLAQVNFAYSKGTPFEKEALRQISCAFSPAELVGIIGQTGSGKSTLAQMFNGLLRPDSGTVLLDGADIWKEPKKMRSVRFRVGIVFQYPEYQLFEETVYKDIAFGPMNMGLSADAVRQKVTQAAEFAGIAPEFMQRSPFELSGGQKRRVAIAGVMAMDPEILILDEPAAGLDPRGRAEILGGIEAYQETTGKTVIMISHSMEDMAAYAKRLIVLQSGTVAASGTKEEIFGDRVRLAAMGMQLPQATQLLIALAEKGIPVRTDLYTPKEAAQEILRVFGKAGAHA